MNIKLLMTTGLLLGLSHSASAVERNWRWLFVYPPGNSAWSTDQGTAKDQLDGRKFDIRIGGGTTHSEPDHLDLYELRGSIRSKTVSAALMPLDTDGPPTRYSGKLVNKRDGAHIFLVGTDGSTVLLYASVKPQD